MLSSLEKSNKKIQYILSLTEWFEAYSTTLSDFFHIPNHSKDCSQHCSNAYQSGQDEDNYRDMSSLLDQPSNDGNPATAQDD